MNPEPDDTAKCPACDGSGIGMSDYCGFCGGSGGVPLASAQAFSFRARKDRDEARARTAARAGDA